VRSWIEQLVRQGYLDKTGKYNILSLTSKGAAAQRGEETPQLARPSKPSTEKKSRHALRSGTSRAGETSKTKVMVSSGEFDQRLFDELRRVRRKKAEELEVPPFVIFSDAALRDMARRKPLDRAGFLAVHGVGEKKCEAFGDDFLAVIREFRPPRSQVPSRNEAVTADDPIESEDLDGSAPRARERRSRSDTLRQAAELFAQGRSIEEVAESLGRKPSTIGQYLAEYIQQNAIVDPTPWVKPAVFARIREAVAAVGAERLSPIYEHLNGEVDYGEIRICMACLRNLRS